MALGTAVIVRSPLCAKLQPLSPKSKAGCETQNSNTLKTAPQRVEYRAWVPLSRPLEPRRPGFSLALAHRTGCWREEAAPEPFRQFQRLPGVLCPQGKPASAAQWRRRLAPQPSGGRAEAPWRRPRGRCRSHAAGALGATVPGCAGGRGREGRGPWEPDARAWCRWRRGQSRNRTLIFDLATGRCFTARCPPGLSASPGSEVSRSGARGDELLSAPPGSPVLLLLLPPPLLLPPSLRQSSGGSRSRRPRPPAEGGAVQGHTDTRRQAWVPEAV